MACWLPGDDFGLSSTLLTRIGKLVTNGVADVFRLQVEDLARAAATGSAPRGATAADGLANVRAMVALARSVESGDWVRLADVSGGL